MPHQTYQREITPDELVSFNPYSPADNREGYTTHLPWKSRMVGGWIRSALQWKNIINCVSETPYVFGPLSVAAGFQRTIIEHFITDPIHKHARICTRAGKTPDIYVEQDERIEEAYGLLLQDLCSTCMTDGMFDDSKTSALCSTRQGNRILKKYIQDFSWLEWQYNSLGLTRLKAMKDLMKTALVVITQQPFSVSPQPFASKKKPGKPDQTFEEYLSCARIRLENLYAKKAFNIRTFAENATNGKLGYSSWEIVKGSQMHSMVLRRYPLPENIKPGNKVLYMVSPLINKPEIFDLGKGKSVIRGMLEQGFIIYLQDPGEPGSNETDLGLDFYGKTVHDKYLEIIKKQHPDTEIYAMGYCMGGTLFVPYLARRAQERLSCGKEMDIKKVALMATPVKFDDEGSGHGPMRKVISQDYDELLMKQMYGSVNVPPQIVAVGMNEIQQGVQYSVAAGFYNRASFTGAIDDAAPFIYWLTHGTRFGAKAHQQWIKNIFMENRIYKGTYALPSTIPQFDGKSVDMDILKKAGVRFFDYRGERDPISPVGSCVASETWGQINENNRPTTRGGLNRTIEKSIGHIFVVSRTLL
ncbi:MAG: alpha/beta hydrolase, partial [Desulfobacteraceae bacterium]|nr:alpha/beta hydrolase [Desulfobacteraceae bacterium]